MVLECGLIPRGSVVFRSARFDDKRGETVFEFSFPYAEDARVVGKELFREDGVVTLSELAALIEADGLQNNGR